MTRDQRGRQFRNDARKLAMRGLRELAVHQLLVLAARADHRGDQSSRAAEGAAIECPLQKTPFHAKHRPGQRDRRLVLEVAGVDRLEREPLEEGARLGNQPARLEEPRGVAGALATITAS